MVKFQFNRNRTLKKVRTQTQNQMWKEADGKASTDKKLSRLKWLEWGLDFGDKSIILEIFRSSNKKMHEEN
jgi:hypothetical protein